MVYSEKCKKTDKNRTIQLNRELTSMHKEVIENLESIHGALLRMNRSIQAEGTFGIIKNNRNYKRIVRKGIKSVKLDILGYLITAISIKPSFFLSNLSVRLSSSSRDSSI